MIFVYIAYGHHNKYSQHLSSHIIIEFIFLVIRIFRTYSLSNFQICSTVLLTIVTTLYTISPWFIYFITGSLYLLTTFICFSHPTTTLLPLATSNLFYLWAWWVFLLYFLFLDSTWKMIQYLSFPVWLIFFFICSEFCHTLKWNSYGFTCVPHPDPPSHLSDLFPIA